MLRTTINGKRCNVGIGSYESVTLAKAREAAAKYKVEIESGVDPIGERKAQRVRQKEEQAFQLTFQKAAEEHLVQHMNTFGNEKHRKQWHSTLSTYAFPVIGQKSVNAISTQDIYEILAPLWESKHETASRLRGRIESVFDRVISLGVRKDGKNPAAWKANLDGVLPKPAKVKKVTHHKSLEHKGFPQFYLDLCREEGVGALALRLQILCASRSGEVRGAVWSEFDLKGNIWTIPAERMKARKEHRVPLGPAAVHLLRGVQARGEKGPLVFQSVRGKMLSDMTLTQVLRRMKVDAVPHGMRATFKSWASSETQHPRDVIEMALAHTLENKVEAAYQRSDLLDKRRRLMMDWEEFCLSSSKPASRKETNLRAMEALINRRSLN